MKQLYIIKICTVKVYLLRFLCNFYYICAGFINQIC